MAKWGEGDPRWIVEERPDAKNVNNWHWSEKNASPWSRDKLKQLLLSVKLQSNDSKHGAHITEVSRIEGEATANNRKAKLIFFYEWQITAKWKGQWNDEEFEGEIEIPNLSDEFEAKDIDVNVSSKSTGNAVDCIKELLRTKGQSLIREKLGIYINDLKQEFSKDLILPTNNTNKPVEKVVSQNSAKPNEKVTPNVSDNTATQKSEPAKVGVAIGTRNLSMCDHFKCRAHELYNCFVQPEIVSAFSRSSCELDAIKGGTFSLYGGMVDGIFDQLTSEKTIVMRWRMKFYPPGHYANITLNFNETEENTELKLEATQVPDSNYDQTEDGWKRHYFENIKRTFCFGSNLA